MLYWKIGFIMSAQFFPHFLLSPGPLHRLQWKPVNVAALLFLVFLQWIYSASNRPWGGKGCVMNAGEDFPLKLNSFHLGLFDQSKLCCSSENFKYGISHWFSNLSQQLKYNLQCRIESCDSPKHKTFSYNFPKKQKVSGKYKREDKISSLEKKWKWHQRSVWGERGGLLFWTFFGLL